MEKYNSTAAMSYKVVRAMAELFDVLYKRGVRDAAAVGASLDEDFVGYGEIAATGRYFVLRDGKAEELSWSAWRAALYVWAGEQRAFRSYIQDYIRRVNEYKGAYACFYPIAFDYYLRGIFDYAESPASSASLAEFMRATKLRLRDFNNGRYRKRVTLRNVVSEVQNFAYERMLNEANVGYHKALGQSSYTKFSQNFWVVTSAYAELQRQERIQKAIDKARMEGKDNGR